MKLTSILAALVLIMITGCASSTPILPTDTSTPDIPTATPTTTDTPTPTLTFTSTVSPTTTETPTPEDTPTPTETPTPEQAIVTALGTVNCRYGPDTAYMYAWGLSEGDLANLDGRNYAATWLYVQPHDTNWHCWVAANTVNASVDVQSVDVVYPPLLVNPSVPAPSGVTTTRSGNSVIVSWNAAPPAVGLGYLIEARVCNGQYLMDVYFQTTNTSYTLTDRNGCSGDSYGQVRVFYKTGYSSAVRLNWPGH